MLIITRYIARHELAPLKRYLGLAEVLAGAKKALKGLATETKPPRALSGFRFYKVRLNGKQSARIIVFVLVENGKVVPLIIRLKKDKLFGRNMAMSDPDLVKQMNNNLDQALGDITNNQYQEFPL